MGSGPELRRADYLQCRRGRWFVRLRVPVHLVAVVGQSHLVRSLDTDSEAVAQERRWLALSLLWDWIGAQTVSDGWEPAWAANLTVAERSPNDGGHDRPVPSLHGGADHPPTRVPKLRSASGWKDDHPTILTMMTRWLKEQRERFHVTMALRVRCICSISTTVIPGHADPAARRNASAAFSGGAIIGALGGLIGLG